jgi:hypothetical protein
MADTKNLSAESEVRIRRYLPEVFVQTKRGRSEVFAKKKKKANTFRYMFFSPVANVALV